MSMQLLGLELSRALARLSEAGVEPEVTETRSPRRGDEAGVLRVVSAAQDGSRLIVSRFLDPLAGLSGERPDSET